MYSVFIILLGCNINSILKNRLETSFNYINVLNKNLLDFVSTPNTIYNAPMDIGYNTPYNTLYKNPDLILEAKTKITWFLSGGIKYSHPGAKSEASIMKSHIDDFIRTKFTSQPNSKLIEWDFVLDELSTNTAENFIRASVFLNHTSNTYDSVYIVTSNFHYERASMMMGLVDQSREYKWILGDAEEHNSRSMEKIHIKNVHSDVTKARVSLK